MVANRTLGPIQVHSLDVSSLNLAFAEIQNRLDAIKGLRGRSEVWDRVRADNPSVDSDAVTLGLIEEGDSVSHVSLHASTSSPLLAYQPGVAYVEVTSGLRQTINFAATISIEGRMQIYGFGTETGSGKGVALTQTDGTLICEVTWDSNGQAKRVGTYTAITLTTDTSVQVRAKGSSATESLVLNNVAFDIRYSVNILGA